jgi:subtilase family serine protease
MGSNIDMLLSIVRPILYIGLVAPLIYLMGFYKGYVVGNDEGYMERRAEEAIDYPPVNRFDHGG